MHKRKIGRIVLSCIYASGGKLVANALDRIFKRHQRMLGAFVVLPIFDVMLVSSFVVKPGVAFSYGSSASSDRRTVSLKIFYAFEKFGRRKL
jgi:hypothetical protein